MSVQIAWLPSQDSFIASYDVERAVAISGPWTRITNVPHDKNDVAVYDPALETFFYVDISGTPGYFYRLTSLDDQGVKSAPSAPFRAAASTPVPFSASLVSEVLITAGNADVLLALGYTTIEVWKSNDFGNSFQEITSSVYAPAVLHASPPNTRYYLKSAVLSFMVDGAITPDIEFGGITEYYTATTAAAVINAVVPNLASVGPQQELVLTSPKVGRFSSLQVYKSRMAGSLGLPTDRVSGTDPRIQIVASQPIYFFYDPIPSDIHGHSDGLSATRSSIRYKWRYSSDGLAPFSNYSEAVLDSALRLGVDPSLLAIGTAIFVGPNGRAQRKSVLVSASSIQKVGGVTLSPDVTMTVTADDTGFCQIPLIRGTRVTLAIEGTNVVREIVVPDEQVFDIMEAIAVAPDQFAVQSPVPLLTRRSL